MPPPRLSSTSDPRRSSRTNVRPPPHPHSIRYHPVDRKVRPTRPSAHPRVMARSIVSSPVDPIKDYGETIVACSARTEAPSPLLFLPRWSSRSLYAMAFTLTAKLSTREHRDYGTDAWIRGTVSDTAISFVSFFSHAILSFVSRFVGRSTKLGDWITKCIRVSYNLNNYMIFFLADWIW